MSTASRSLFEAEVPDGFRYQRDFITGDEETRLATEIARIEFANFEMRGVVARRRVAFFGRSYDATAAPVPPIPELLLPLRERVAAFAGVAADAFAMALVNEYRPGAPIGWHRDAPQYDIVAGVSLLSACRMKFRPYVRAGGRAAAAGRRIATHEIDLEPRSAYVMAGSARLRTSHPCGRHAALLDYVPNAAVAAHRHAGGTARHAVPVLRR